MSKLLIVSAVFPPEPVVSAKLSFDIANALSKNNTVTIISPKPSRPFGFKFKDVTTNYRLKHIQLNSFTCAASSIIGRFRESFSFGRHCYKFIADNRANIDVIYANTWPLFGQYFAVKAARRYNIPIAIHVQDIYPESLIHKIPKQRGLLNSLLLPLDKYILQHATQIIAISDKMKCYLATTRNLESKKIAIVQNWQDEADFLCYKSGLNRTNEKCDSFTFMYLGNVGPVAGIDLLIIAFTKANLKNCRLVIAGAGSMKNILQNKAKLAGMSTIEFWDVPDGKVPEIQDQADIMILPIKKGAASSSIPSKLPAYMFSKKPIIASVDHDSDTASVINTSCCGWVLPPEEIISLTEMMQKVVYISNEVLLKKGENGFSYAIENFSKKNNLEKIVKCITDTIV